MKSISHLEREIREQPEIIRALIAQESNHISKIAQQIQGNFQYILIAARGSSDNAARYAQYLFGINNQIPIILATPSLFSLYQAPPRLDGALVIGISQSGQSPDIVEVIQEAKRQGRPTLVLTNDLSSPLVSASDHVINLHAGIEKAVAATKTYTSSLLALVLLSAYLENNPFRISQITNVSDYQAKTISLLDPILDRIERYRFMDHCVVIGRGLNYATSFEIALKIKELTHIIAEPYSSADFRHGPIAMVSDGFPIILVAPNSIVLEDVRGLISDLMSRKGELIIISDNDDLLNLAQLALPICPGIPEFLSPLVSVIPGQLFALRLAQYRGMNPDFPTGIQKITETF